MIFMSCLKVAIAPEGKDLHYQCPLEVKNSVLRLAPAPGLLPSRFCQFKVEMHCPGAPLDHLPKGRASC